MNGTVANGTVVNGSGSTAEAPFLPLLTPAAEIGTDSPAPPPERDPLPIIEPWPELEQDELETERAGLEAEIAAAKARTAAAKHRAAQRDAEMRAALRVELEASKEALAEMEREHAAAIALVREAADVEVAGILAAARQQVAAPVKSEPRTVEPRRDAE